MLDCIWAGNCADEFFQGAGYPLWILLRFLEFFAHSGRGTLSEESLQIGLAVEKNFKILRIL